MRTESPTITPDVTNSDLFIYRRDPRARTVTSYRASDGFEIGTDGSMADAIERTEVFQDYYTGELF